MARLEKLVKVYKVDHGGVWKVKILNRDEELQAKSRVGPVSRGAI